ncbi:hypothetical protein N0B44_03475 [Roseibacterium beibuensis]|uniref:Regulatory protein SoxS n=2 Tax=[Roseibacterium] beibuensis TaxID=1193142 RepID=A0ABP9KYL7_9RHOB|nr:hypothetical protein [Roseibacterium beibuensis]
MVVALGSLLPLPALADLQLIMIEQTGCFYCARWHEEVGDAYDRTPEGAVAPLRMLQLSEPIPDDLDIQGRAVFTPTFILVSDGREVGRLEGYPGEDFFWGLLQRMIEQTGVDLETEAAGATN